MRTFDGANRITAIGNEAYAYDGHGRRVATWKADGGAKVEVYTQTGQLGFVVDSDKGGGSSFVYLGNLRIAEEHWQCATDTRTATYLHSDILGSPVAETDSNRIATVRTHYAPYGEPLNRTVDGPGYTGHVHDAATGLVYAQQRYYDPIVGRFLSIDPVAADPDSGSNFNRYWYANNNPYRFTDPDGRASCESCQEVFDRAFPQGDVFRVAGEALGANVAFAVGVATGDQALQDAAVEGMRENVTTADGVSAAAMLVGGRGGRGGAKEPGAVHGNSRASTKPQQRYEIRETKTGDVVKTGISGRELNKNGTSPRANSQVNALNKAEGEGAFSARVAETGIPGRSAALSAEQSATNTLRAEGNSLRLQQRPQPEQIK